MSTSKIASSSSRLRRSWAPASSYSDRLALTYFHLCTLHKICCSVAVAGGAVFLLASLFRSSSYLVTISLLVLACTSRAFVCQGLAGCNLLCRHMSGTGSRRDPCMHNARCKSAAYHITSHHIGITVPNCVNVVRPWSQCHTQFQQQTKLIAKWNN